MTIDTKALVEAITAQTQRIVGLRERLQEAEEEFTVAERNVNHLRCDLSNAKTAHDKLMKQLTEYVS